MSKKKEISTILTIRPAINAGSSLKLVDKCLEISNIERSSDLDDFILLHSSLYRVLFGSTKTKSPNRRKRASIVKIDGNNGKTIQREFKGYYIGGFTNNMAALSLKSQLLLIDRNGNSPTKLVLSKGNYWSYYRNHPDNAIRISFKMGFLSILLGFMSLIVAFKDPIMKFIRFIGDSLGC